MKTLIGNIFILVLCVGCCKTQTRYIVQITNNSDDAIGCYFYLAWKGGNEGVVYPDTTLVLLEANEVLNIKPGQIHHVSRFLSPIAERVQSLPYDTLSVFFFSQDTLNTYSWEEIKQEYKVLQRYDLSVKNFQTLLNQYEIPEISYPPDERMKDMKMYPQYGK